MNDTRILVVAPHHDDEAIGCGGFLCRRADEHAFLSAVFVFAPLEGIDSEAGARRLAEASAAAALLGITQHQSLNLPCRRGMAVATLAWKLVAIFRSLRPTTVLVPHARERDPEHRLVRKAAIEAAWLGATAFRAELGAPAPPVQTILGYEVWTPIARPQMHVDITAVLPRKMNAVAAYGSQLQVHDYAEASAGLARYRGAMMAGCTYAEVFTIERATAERFLF